MEKAKAKKISCSCDICMYYDYNEEIEDYECNLSLDQDDYQRFRSSKSKDCPYFRFYDEYKSVQRQN